MSRICLIAACGTAGRTGVGQYTSKAALRLRGRPLLSHQFDFAKRSGVDRVLVVTRTEHVRLLASLLSEKEKAMASFAICDKQVGWAGTIESALAHVADKDEILLVSCDNYHTALHAKWPAYTDALFTYTYAENATNGPVLGSVDGVWQQRPPNFKGNVFTGYAVVRGAMLRRALRDIAPSERGEKEFTALLEVLSNPQGIAVPYGGEYIDIADLRALARLDTRLRRGMAVDGIILPCTAPVGEIQIGAGVLLCDRDGRVLLTERQDDLGWSIPGGIVDPGETYVQTAIRETREEIGVSVVESDLRLLGVYPSINKQGGPGCSVVFHAEVREQPAMQPDPKEVRNAGWFTHEQSAAVSIAFDLRDAVDDLFAGRKLDTRP